MHSRTWARPCPFPARYLSLSHSHLKPAKFLLLSLALSLALYLTLPTLSPAPTLSRSFTHHCHSLNLHQTVLLCRPSASLYQSFHSFSTARSSFNQNKTTTRTRQNDISRKVCIPDPAPAEPQHATTRGISTARASHRPPRRDPIDID